MSLFKGRGKSANPGLPTALLKIKTSPQGVATRDVRTIQLFYMRERLKERGRFIVFKRRTRCTKKAYKTVTFEMGSQEASNNSAGFQNKVFSDRAQCEKCERVDHIYIIVLKESSFCV